MRGARARTRTRAVGRDELQQWYVGFMADCPSGLLSKEEFQRVYRQFFPFGDPTPFANDVFGVIDVNKDGKSVRPRPTSRQRTA